MNWFKSILPEVEKVHVYVFIHEEYKTVMLFSYDQKGLEEVVNKYSMKGYVESRELSFFAHRHLKKTVSELRFNHMGDIIVKSATNDSKSKAK